MHSEEKKHGFFIQILDYFDLFCYIVRNIFDPLIYLLINEKKY